MDTARIPVKRLNDDALLPVKAHDDDAGYDLFACDSLTIPSGESRLVPTGVALALPPRMEAQIRPRSGLALRDQITVLNSPGTIDAGYRGEVGVILMNHGKEAFAVTKGMKIAQMVITALPDAMLVEADSLDATSRGSGGFGSTGV